MLLKSKKKAQEKYSLELINFIQIKLIQYEPLFQKETFSVSLNMESQHQPIRI